jgi:hemolysin III
MVLYILMGWLVLVAIKPLTQAMPVAGLAWLVAGGVIYSAGIFFYLHDERRKHFHGIWHLFCCRRPKIDSLKSGVPIQN